MRLRVRTNFDKLRVAARGNDAITLPVAQAAAAAALVADNINVLENNAKYNDERAAMSAEDEGLLSALLSDAGIAAPGGA